MASRSLRRAAVTALLVAAPAALLTGVGCSLLVNTDGLDTGDASIHADASSHTDAPGRSDGGRDEGHADTTRLPDGTRDRASADARSDSTIVVVDGGPISLDPGFPVITSLPQNTDMAVMSTFSTPANRVVVVVVVWGIYAGSGLWPVTLDGAGLTWAHPVETFSMVSFPGAVGAGIWIATTDTALSSQTITVTRSNNASSDILMAIYSFANASPTVGGIGTSNSFSGDLDSGVGVTIDAAAAGSVVLCGILDADPNLGGSPFPNTLYDALLASPSGCGLGIARLQGTTAGPGAVTLGQSTTSEDVVAAGAEVPRR